MECTSCGRAEANHCCARCKTAYCSSHCQQQDWSRGNHQEVCIETSFPDSIERAKTGLRPKLEFLRLWRGPQKLIRDSLTKRKGPSERTKAYDRSMPFFVTSVQDTFFNSYFGFVQEKESSLPTAEVLIPIEYLLFIHLDGSTDPQLGINWNVTKEPKKDQVLDSLFLQSDKKFVRPISETSKTRLKASLKEGDKYKTAPEKFTLLSPEHLLVNSNQNILGGYKGLQNTKFKWAEPKKTGSIRIEPDNKVARNFKGGPDEYYRWYVVFDDGLEKKHLISKSYRFKNAIVYFLNDGISLNTEYVGTFNTSEAPLPDQLVITETDENDVTKEVIYNPLPPLRP
jgi:hypothetical protein